MTNKEIAATPRLTEEDGQALHDRADAEDASREQGRGHHRRPEDVRYQTQSLDAAETGKDSRCPLRPVWSFAQILFVSLPAADTYPAASEPEIPGRRRRYAPTRPSPIGDPFFVWKTGSLSYRSNCRSLVCWRNNAFSPGRVASPGVQVWALPLCRLSGVQD